MANVKADVRERRAGQGIAIELIELSSGPQPESSNRSSGRGLRYCSTKIRQMRGDPNGELNALVHRWESKRRPKTGSSLIHWTMQLARAAEIRT